MNESSNSVQMLIAAAFPPELEPLQAWDLSSFSIDWVNVSCMPSAPPLQHSRIEHVMMRFFFPVLFLFGLVGNSLNLVVLLDSSQNNVVNLLLAAMAFSDILLLCVLLPDSLGAFETFYRRNRYRYIYYEYQMYRNALANLFSAAASWLVLAVSLERYIGIRSPWHTRSTGRGDKRVYLVIGLIYAAAFCATFFHNLEYSYDYVLICNSTLIKGRTRRLGKHEPGDWKTTYINVAKDVQLATVVILPVLAVGILNIALLRILRRHTLLNSHRSLSSDDDTGLTFEGGNGGGGAVLRAKWSKETTGGRSTPRSDQGGSERYAMAKESSASAGSAAAARIQHSEWTARLRQERKVTISVLAIVSCFTITHVPSSVPFIWERISHPPDFVFSVYNPIAVSLLLLGKVLNFVLFCLSSAHFRRRLVAILWGKCVRSATCLASLPLTTSASNQHHLTSTNCTSLNHAHANNNYHHHHQHHHNNNNNNNHTPNNQMQMVEISAGGRSSDFKTTITTSTECRRRTEPVQWRGSRPLSNSSGTGAPVRTTTSCDQAPVFDYDNNNNNDDDVVSSSTDRPPRRMGSTSERKVVAWAEDVTTPLTIDTHNSDAVFQPQSPVVNDATVISAPMFHTR